MLFIVLDVCNAACYHLLFLPILSLISTVSNLDSKCFLEFVMITSCNNGNKLRVAISMSTFFRINENWL